MATKRRARNRREGLLNSILTTPANVPSGKTAQPAMAAIIEVSALSGRATVSAYR